MVLFSHEGGAIKGHSVDLREEFKDFSVVTTEQTE